MSLGLRSYVLRYEAANILKTSFLNASKEAAAACLSLLQQSDLIKYDAQKQHGYRESFIIIEQGLQNDFGFFFHSRIIFPSNQTILLLKGKAFV